MSYEKAIQKMQRLEKKGYLTYGDKSTTYCKDTNVYKRFFSDSLTEENKNYLKQKIIEYLTKENVLFAIGYTLEIVPTEQLKQIIEEANTYAEMEKELKNVPFVSSDNYGGNLRMKFKATYGDYTSDLTLMLVKKFCDDFCNDDITCEIKEDYGNHSSAYIHSRKCEDDVNVKKAIDELFI